MRHAAVVMIVAVSLALIAVSAVILGGRDVTQEPLARYQLLSHSGALWMLDQMTGELFRVSPAARDETARAGQQQRPRTVNVRWLPLKRPPITVTIPKPAP